MDQQYAYVTGAASGCGLAISTFLVGKGVKVFLADFDEKNLRVAAEQLRSPFAVVNVADWESQVKGFKEAVSQFGRIDYLPDDFAKPNLSIIEINITGLLYSIALALQQFRRQDLGNHGYRGKILCPGSIMGIYPCAGNPIYNTSKHAVRGLVRSYGRQLPGENITMSAFCPSSIKTGFSNDDYYKKLEEEDLVTPMEGVLEVVEKTFGTGDMSGECFEIRPNYHNGQGLVNPKFPDYIDGDMRRVFELINARGKAK
ncbi:hypothetical protein CDV36_011887 [Fusarium kuroshium]|uniref:NAD(P)-binding protein n=1 Tax=Fusarium kuroshium TaxID=2010991 RepID=A0A3M2RT95_9HYPO|nr:hypothetical protein CDV36_011887 [Fusarium kuroshium]